MPFTRAPAKPDRLEFRDWQPPQRVVLTRKGFLIPLDCDENRALARVIEPALTFDYPENVHAGRWAKRKPPLLAYCRDVDPHTQKEYLLVPKQWGIRHFGGRDGFTYTNEQAPGVPMRDGLAFTERRELLETERQPQRSVAAFAMEHLRRTGGAVLALPVGTGKTVLGLYIAMQLGVKTLVVAAKGDLLEQWAERMHEYVPGCRIGRIQADVCETDDCDFVLATAQSLAMKVYDPDMLRQFGFLLFDEAHHAAAPSFLHAVRQAAAPFMCALTADPTRSDGMTEILYQFFSWNVYVVQPVLPSDIFLNVRVHRLTQRCYTEDADMVDAKPRRERAARHPRADDAETRAERPATPMAPVDDISDVGYTTVYKGVARQANRNALIVAYIKHFLAHTDVDTVHAPTADEVNAAAPCEAIADHARRHVRVRVDDDATRLVSELSIDETKRLVQTERQVLVLSVHKEHLLSLYARLVRSGVPEHLIAIYWGDLKPEQRKDALFSRCILATFEMAAEGLDLPTLNTVIFATPRSKTADQAVGRMLRDKLNAAIQPCLIDIVDEWCEFASAMYWKRHRTYKSYLPQACIEFYDDDRTDAILGQYCKKRPAVIRDPTKRATKRARAPPAAAAAQGAKAKRLRTKRATKSKKPKKTKPTGGGAAGADAIDLDGDSDGDKDDV